MKIYLKWQLCNKQLTVLLFVGLSSDEFEHSGLARQIATNNCFVLLFVGLSSDEFEHSGLARQVSVLLTNHLSHATEGKGNEAASNEALQEVLSLLNNLSRLNSCHINILSLSFIFLDVFTHKYSFNETQNDSIILR